MKITVIICLTALTIAAGKFATDILIAHAPKDIILHEIISIDPDRLAPKIEIPTERPDFHTELELRPL
jgi:hypothetical protein